MAASLCAWLKRNQHSLTKEESENEYWDNRQAAMKYNKSVLQDL